MMFGSWQQLIGNLATVALIVSAWMHVSYHLELLSAPFQRHCLGIAMGLAAVASMLMSVQFHHGIFLDLRFSLVMAAGAFAGPSSVAIVALMTGALRYAMGGIGTGPAIIAIAVVAGCACAIWYAAGKRPIAGILPFAFVGLGSATAPILEIAFFAKEDFYNALSNVALPIAVLSCLSTVAIGVIIAYFARFTHEREINYAALTQAPGYHYVKDLEYRFVITNHNVASYHSRGEQSETRGLSDFDLEPHERAVELYERSVMETGKPFQGFEECLAEPGAAPRWFSTSKAPPYNRAGELVGIAGTTVEITERKKLESSLLHSRNLMARAMADMSDGLAMFDPNGELQFCNEQYRGMFPKSAYARHEGASIRDIIRAAAEAGERFDFPVEMDEDSIGAAAANLFVDKDETIEMRDSRWLSLRTRVADDGTALVLVSDITAQKQAELNLQVYADKMKNLALTDSLTGLPNRRKFDETLKKEYARALDSGSQLTLVMIDVDRFKSYNDTFGHVAGDACLKQVGRCVRAAAKHSGHLSARFGGEEFALLLPDTSLEAAVRLSEDLRETIHGLAIAQTASETGFVTASFGIATVSSRQAPPDPAALVRLADAALYRSKREGRNKISVADASFGAASLARSA